MLPCVLARQPGYECPSIGHYHPRTMSNRRSTLSYTSRQALGRGLIRRCPRCGQGRLFSRWFTAPDVCPRCGLSFDRGEGFWLGTMAVNMGATEATFGAIVVVWLVLVWPDVNWTLLTIVALLLNAVLPLVFYPFAKTTFVAIDLLLRGADVGGRDDPEPDIRLRPVRVNSGSALGWDRAGDAPEEPVRSPDEPG
jgi:uncharacterized protein (DUF983 family)